MCANPNPNPSPSPSPNPNPNPNPNSNAQGLDLETLLTSGKSPFPERVLCSWLQVGAREVTY